MSITGKMSAGMISVATCMKNGVDNCKIEGKVAEQNKKIKLLTKEIANLTMMKLDGGEEMCPEIMERYAAIQEAREQIQQLEADKKVSKKMCPVCNKKTSFDMQYCGYCGESLVEVV